MPADTRTRMVEAAVAALQQRGAAGMSFSEVLEASGAARGAIYHHFPGGKAQLVAEAAARNGSDVRAALAELAVPAPGGPQQVVTAFLDAVRPVLGVSTEGGGCAVAAITVGADPGPPDLRRVAADAFAGWIDELAARLAAAGTPSGEAVDLATTLVTLLEGAHVLCRAAGTLEPFERVARCATELVAGHRDRDVRAG
jgi:AcrR family transcriptional regulator